MRIQAPTGPRNDLETLRQLYSLATQALAPIDETSNAYNAVMEGIALARIDLVAHSLKRFVSVNCERLPLTSRGIILGLAVKLQKGEADSLVTASRQLREYHSSLGLSGGRQLAS